MYQRHGHTPSHLDSASRMLTDKATLAKERMLHQLNEFAVSTGAYNHLVEQLPGALRAVIDTTDTVIRES